MKITDLTKQQIAKGLYDMLTRRPEFESEIHIFLPGGRPQTLTSVVVSLPELLAEAQRRYA